MKKLLFLGGRSWGIEYLIQCAKAMGAYTIVADYNDTNIGKSLSDEAWMISTRNVDALETRCREEGIDGILCGIHEENMDIALQLCSRLHLPCYYNEKAWSLSRNKAAFKRICEATGTSVPERFYVDENSNSVDLKAIDYPVVVKAVDLCGSNGMSYCYNDEQLMQGLQYARSYSKNHEVLVEKMIIGKEYTAFYALAEGETRLLCVTEMVPCSGEKGWFNFFIETTVTDNYQYIIKEISPHIENSLKAAGCRDGVAWVEFMMDQNRNYYVLEFGHRLAGTMVERTLPNTINFDPYKWVVECSLGIPHTVDDLPVPITCFPGKCGCGYMLKATQLVDHIHIYGFEDIKKIPGVTCSILRDDEKSAAFDAYHGYVAVVTISANDCEDFCDKFQKVNGLIRMEDPEGNDIFRRFEDYEFFRENYRNAFLT